MSNANLIRINLETEAMRRFYARLEAEVDGIAHDLGLGAGIDPDGKATAERYCKFVGVSEGLRRALDLCKEVEDQIIRGK